MKNIILMLFLSGSIQLLASPIKVHYAGFEIEDFSFSEPVKAITEPYAIVDFRFNAKHHNPGESLALIITTDLACWRYDFTADNTIRAILNTSSIEFRIENESGEVLFKKLNQPIVQTKLNTIKLRRLIADKLNNSKPIEPSYPVMSRKPVIYLYGNGKTSYTCTFKKEIPNLFTYPAIQNIEQRKGWKVIPYADGELLNEKDNKSYPYLFWEAQQYLNFKWDRGFRVEKDRIIQFLEQKLTQMNLSQEEKNDFITYWAPVMKSYSSHLDVQFIFNETYKNQIADISVNPALNNEFRVYMVFRISENINLIEQKIPSAVRMGAYYIEWGGANLNE